jgi:hypothetical protein
MTATNRQLLERLEGGDLRSIGASNAIVEEALADPGVAETLFGGLVDGKPVVRMRAADALEKIARRNPAVLAGRAQLLLRLLAAPQPKEVRWHLLQLVPRITWPRRSQPALLAAVLACFADRSSIVRTSALQALFDLRPQGAAFVQHYSARRRQALASGTPAMRARARKLQAVENR